MSEIAKVYLGLAKILESMSVEKGGTLPANMGGKPYITAVDLALEAKRQFVENNLILIPSERVVRSENLIVKDRTTVSIVIEGTYTVVSTEDGSSITFGGVGDGLAIGTAVASNIASTNALKNALLRLFLVTEQSAEDSGKEGVPAESGAAPEGKEKPLSLTDVKFKIGQYIKSAKNPDGAYDAEQVNAIGDRVAGTTPKDRKWTLPNYKAILAELERGVTE